MVFAVQSPRLPLVLLRGLSDVHDIRILFIGYLSRALQMLSQDPDGLLLHPRVLFCLIDALNVVRLLAPHPLGQLLVVPCLRNIFFLQLFKHAEQFPNDCREALLQVVHHSNMLPVPLPLLMPLLQTHVKLLLIRVQPLLQVLSPLAFVRMLLHQLLVVALQLIVSMEERAMRVLENLVLSPHPVQVLRVPVCHYDAVHTDRTVPCRFDLPQSLQ
mmetsp:Transcript_62363/g.179371  ORF Transcript_62363/g.179371 Transcript_62363/m.179371 type:complete len:215 (-) Transcript_62363:1089-1733(-)